MCENKINIGAGKGWYKAGWESLERKKYVSKGRQHVGKAWNTKLPSNHYDALFAGNILEHVTHFKIERTIAEFNRILKTGGIARITVPDLKKAAAAYVNGDSAFFENEKGNTVNHLGIGSTFMNNIVSPGHEVVAFTSDFREMLGCYAHTYAYDFEMLKILLEKWGFGKIREAKFLDSSIPDMREEHHAILNGEKHGVYDEGSDAAIKKDPENNFLSGFDSFPHKTLFVEAEKVKDVPYSPDLEFPYHRNSASIDCINKIKTRLFHLISVLVDFVFVKSGILTCAKWMKRALRKKS